MFENLCSLPLSGELFTQALHPNEPILAVGLSTGHVECFRLPAPDKSDEDGDSADMSILSDGKGTIDTIWRTRRHKGSCRTLGFSEDGSALYSAGTDGIVKHFSPITGQVASKLAIPSTKNEEADAPTTLQALSPHNLLLGCDSGRLHVLDLRDGAITNSKPSLTLEPHIDFISSITPLPPTAESTSGFSKQWVSTGGTTLSVSDIRKGVISRSENQEDELLSTVFVPNMGPKKNRQNGVLVVGGATGVLTLWDKGAWDDQTDRIFVNRTSESLDSLAIIPKSVAGSRPKVAVGVGDGSIRIVDLAARNVETILRHDEVEAVVALGFDCEGRMISGGGTIVKVWEEADARTSSNDSEAEEDDDDSDDSDNEPTVNGKAFGKRQASSDDDSSDNSDSDEGSRKRKKKKRGKGKVVELGPHGAHGILKFKGLD